MESLETKDRETLEKALVDPRWTPYSLSTALEKRGLALADKLIRKHLNAECTCKQLG